MANLYGQYSPAVPLSTTWKESMTYLDADGAPVLLDGLHIVAQLRETLPTTPTPEDPILEITTVGYRDVAPGWPVVEGFSVAGNVIALELLRAQFAAIVSPTNARAKLLWQVLAVNKSTGYGVPIVEGKVSFQPARTLV